MCVRTCVSSDKSQLLAMRELGRLLTAVANATLRKSGSRGCKLYVRNYSVVVVVVAIVLVIIAM